MSTGESNVSSPRVLRDRQPALVAGRSWLRATTDMSSAARAQRATVIVVLLVAALLPLGLSSDISFLSFGALIWVYSLAALSVFMLYRIGGMISVAQGPFVGVAAYASVLVAQRLDWSFIPSVGCAVLVSVGVAALLALLSVRVAGDYFIIATFAVGMVLAVLENNLTSLTGGSGGLSFVGVASLFGIQLNPGTQMAWYYVIFVLFCVSLLAVGAFRYSRLGMRLAAVRENPALASSLGTNALWMRCLAFAGAGVFAGLAGGVWPYVLHYVSPDQFEPGALGITLIMMVLVGGGRSGIGCVIGGFIALVATQLLGISAVVNEILLGVLLVLVILLSPDGVCGLCKAAGARLWSLARFVAKRHIAQTPVGPEVGER
jgi:branched-chain amino acid transport system permease protein